MINHILTGTLLLAGIAFAPLANAIATSSSEPLVLTHGTTAFGKTFAANTKGNTFTNDYTFSTSAASSLTGAVISIKGLSTDLNITGFNLIPTVGATITGLAFSSGYVDAWLITAPNLLPGNYTLEVTGKVLGDGGSYGGNVNVSAVPEPETWGMMIGGLGLIGMAIGRRTKRTPTFTA
ncbi:FxDxF family PEP-CTERM protein [Actimicrobium sp. CCC2.4]|uniref:FxDxF family PEP-CTERM protein n=1 Tax=Actimicrobium sp. CCC2.4 TaxID=3048606 RepID=UPI002AC9CCF3|nr:FxDxF family PEP-CTERM protein [Actimicrobium sp. CCC2.4]MEB0137132.1 FxDxF family PEP-CTERM protein [Actimicrobium sp. CCC2.4]WPX30932.1 FxDxF family PEP-CTERM protein [Actimicrobium sp. CCC2.4]